MSCVEVIPEVKANLEGYLKLYATFLKICPWKPQNFVDKNFWTEH